MSATATEPLFVAYPTTVRNHSSTSVKSTNGSSAHEPLPVDVPDDDDQDFSATASDSDAIGNEPVTPNSSGRVSPELSHDLSPSALGPRSQTNREPMYLPKDSEASHSKPNSASESTQPAQSEPFPEFPQSHPDSHLESTSQAAPPLQSIPTPPTSVESSNGSNSPASLLEPNTSTHSRSNSRSSTATTTPSQTPTVTQPRPSFPNGAHRSSLAIRRTFHSISNKVFRRAQTDLHIHQYSEVTVTPPDEQQPRQPSSATSRRSISPSGLELTVATKSPPTGKPATPSSSAMYSDSESEKTGSPHSDSRPPTATSPLTDSSVVTPSRSTPPMTASNRDSGKSTPSSVATNPNRSSMSFMLAVRKTIRNVAAHHDHSQQPRSSSFDHADSALGSSYSSSKPGSQNSSDSSRRGHSPTAASGSQTAVSRDVSVTPHSPGSPQAQSSLAPHSQSPFSPPPNHSHHLFAHHRHHLPHPHISPGEPQVWTYFTEAGTGLKARRISLSLPDDFNVDVSELMAEFEYPHRVRPNSLGKGSTCDVKKMCRRGVPEELYAVKQFRPRTKNETSEEYEKKVKSEFTIARSLHHPNIVETVKLCMHNKRWNHVMEYCQHGDILLVMEKGLLDPNPDLIACLSKQLLRGIAYLHENGIAHRDIKLQNLLLTPRGQLKITDFGVSEVFSGIHPGLREAGGVCGQEMGPVRYCKPDIVGSEPYISPEVLAKQSEYDPRALDVWGAGVCILNMYLGGGLWSRAKAEDDAGYQAFANAYTKWETKVGADAPISEDSYPSWKPVTKLFKPALRRLLYAMLRPNPALRITAKEALLRAPIYLADCCQQESYDEPAQVIDASKLDLKKRADRTYVHTHIRTP